MEMLKVCFIIICMGNQGVIIKPIHCYLLICPLYIKVKSLRMIRGNKGCKMYYAFIYLDSIHSMGNVKLVKESNTMIMTLTGKHPHRVKICQLIVCE
jgi:hypothetical protein